MDEKKLCYTSAIDLAELIRRKDISPVEVVDAVLNRIEKINPKINAYCTMLADEAREEARKAEKALMRGKGLGRLHGVPMSIKDIIFTKGVRTTAGSKIFEHFVPDDDEPCVSRLKEAGAILVGKTANPELAWKDTTDSPLFGLTRNPWNLGRSTGGSSGGSGAAIAAGLAPLTVGSDAGGSIRIPSSFCGVFGLKPSFGRVPRYPSFPGWELVNHSGPLTRTVSDAALVMDIISGPDPRDRFSLPSPGLSYLQTLKAGLKGLRVAWSKDLGFAIVDRQVAKVTEKAAKVFAGLGCSLEEVNPDFGDSMPILLPIYMADVAGAVADEFDTWRPFMDPVIMEVVEEGLKLTATDYVKATFKMQEYNGKVQAFFEKYHLLLTPTLAIPPFEADAPAPTEIAGKPIPIFGYIPFSPPFNLTGQPAASVPCGWTDDGLPIGLQIAGRMHEDHRVLQAAYAFEQACPWADRKPPLD